MSNWYKNTFVQRQTETKIALYAHSITPHNYNFMKGLYVLVLLDLTSPTHFAQITSNSEEINTPHTQDLLCIICSQTQALN